MLRRLTAVLVTVTLTIVLLGVGPMADPVVAQTTCPPEVERLIKVGAPKLGSQVLEFYDSWSVKELEAGRKPGTGFTVGIGVGAVTSDTSLFGFWGTIRRLEQMGCKVLYTAGTGGNQAPENAAMIENFVARGVDAVLFIFSNSQILGPGLQKAAAKNIPVFGLDNWLSGPSVVSEITSDNFDIGRKAASYVISRLGGVGNVVEVFSPGHRGVEIRNKMWDMMITEYPEIREVARLPYQFPNVIGSVRDRMEATLLANPKKGSISAVHACYDLPGIGAADAIEAAGRQNEIFVVGIDGDREAMRRIAMGGCFVATISQDFMLMSAAVAHEIVDHLNGKPVPRFLFCPTTLVTKENVFEVYREKYGEELKISK